MTTRKNIIRVLVSDGNQVAREAIIGLLTAEPAICIVGLAINGAETVQLAAALRPDLIIMDVPVMGGLEAVEQIMREFPAPILVVTVQTGARQAYEAVSRGALGVIEKPSLDSITAEQFVRKVKLLAGVPVFRHCAGILSMNATKVKPAGGNQESRYKLVVLAASLGGPQVLEKIISQLPAGFPVPILVVQHIAKGFVAGFAEWLNYKAALKVQVALSGTEPQAGEVWVAPPEKNMEVTKKGDIVLLPVENKQSYHPSCDALMASVARVFGKAAIGVVLTGMGDDGVKGLLQMKAKGALTIAQDMLSCTVDSMPSLAIKSGAADYVMGIDQIRETLVRVTQP